MQLPSFYDPDKVGTLYVPDTASAIQAGQSLRVPPAEQDQQKVLLLLVDAQVDFIHPDGALSVPGAVDDTRRTIEWLFRNVDRLTTIIASLDTHLPFQIFFQSWWIDAAGNHPAPYTPITAKDVDEGIWRPTTEPEWSVQYVHQLAERAKKTLMIWPYHTMMGTPGHSIMPALYEAIAYHAAARQTQPIFLAKGAIPKTEHYSILEPEVKVPEDPLGDLNTPLMETIANYDLIYMAGQAKSHCVLETATSLFRYFSERQPDFIRRWRFLKDCTSSVKHPEIDFDALANAELAKFEAQGMRMVTSTDPIG